MLLLIASYWPITTTRSLSIAHPYRSYPAPIGNAFCIFFEMPLLERMQGFMTFYLMNYKDYEVLGCLVWLVFSHIASKFTSFDFFVIFLIFNLLLTIADRLVYGFRKKRDIALTTFFLQKWYIFGKIFNSLHVAERNFIYFDHLYPPIIQ